MRQGREIILCTLALLAGNALGDVENIRCLGEGWVAEETLAIALYCALRHPLDFSAALIARSASGER